MKTPAYYQKFRIIKDICKQQKESDHLAFHFLAHQKDLYRDRINELLKNEHIYDIYKLKDGHYTAVFHNDNSAYVPGKIYKTGVAIEGALRYVYPEVIEGLF